MKKVTTYLVQVKDSDGDAVTLHETETVLAAETWKEHYIREGKDCSIETRSGIHLGSPFGVPLFLGWTFVALLGATLIMERSRVPYLLVLFLSVLLHEYGHVLTARALGVKTREINLHFLGGSAVIEKMPKAGMDELLIAAAGPVVSLFLSGLFFLAGGNKFLLDCAAMNVGILVFNLIPAYPMDGGRILRSLLSWKLTHQMATKVACRVGQVCCAGFIWYGITHKMLLLALCGLFIAIGATAELTKVNKSKED